MKLKLFSTVVALIFLVSGSVFAGDVAFEWDRNIGGYRIRGIFK